MVLESSRAAALRSFFWPRGIAVVGASADPFKPGGSVVRLLLNFHFPGSIFPVNPGRHEIQGLPCYRTLAEIKEEVDLVVVALAAEQVPALVRECADLGLKNLVVISGGFGEVGGEGSVLQEQLTGLARAHSLRLLGPNCIGFINALQPAAASFSLTIDSGILQPGPVGLIAQSGGLGLLAQYLADRERLGVSYMISTGNEAGITFADVLSFLSREPSVKVIGGYLEGVGEGAALRRSCREAAEAGKPVILLKAGENLEAAEAIRSHTGALAGSREAYRAFFQREGVQQVETMTEMLSLLKAFSPGKLPAGNRVAVYSLSGGMGVLAADLCPGVGLELARFSDRTEASLQRLMPSIATVRNPLDPTAALAASLDDIRASLQLVMDDPGVDMLIFATAFWRLFGDAAAGMLTDLAHRSGKPLLVVWPGCGAGIKQALCEQGVPFYSELKEGLTAAGAMWRYAGFQRQRLQSAPAAVPAVAAAAAGKAAAAIERCGAGLTEAAAKELLALYGIPIPRGKVVQTPEEAASAARKIGYPVALKIVSTAVSHKTEVGGVRLGLAAEPSLRQAWEQMQRDLAEKAPGITPEGFLIEEMLPVSLELMAGARSDPVFGPLLVLGLGGVFVELYKDTVSDIAPVSAARVLEMLGELKSAPLLKGYRGAAAVDLTLLADMVSRFSSLAADLSGMYSEIEINPLVICSDGRIVAADALLLHQC